MLFYTFILAYSQVLIKTGLNQIGPLSIKEPRDILILGTELLKNMNILFGMLLLISSFFLWVLILSWFKLVLVFPLTAVAFIFVALLAYFMLNEKLMLVNYFGIAMIAVGIFLVLYKQS